MVAVIVGTTAALEANGPFTTSYLTAWATVRVKLTAIFADSTDWEYCKVGKRQCNGRKGCLAFLDHYLGQNIVYHMVSAAEKILQNALYHGEQNNNTSERFFFKIKKNLTLFHHSPFHHPPFTHCPIVSFYRSPVRSLIFMPKYLIFMPNSLLFMPISRAAWDSSRGTLCGAREGVPCVARRLLQTCTWCYPGFQFNLLAQSLIPDPSQVPVPVGDWGAKLRRSSVSRTLQRR